MVNRHNNSLHVTFYSPILYPWVVKLQKAFTRKVGKARTYTSGSWGNYPDWKHMEKEINVIPYKEILGDRFLSLRSIFNIFSKQTDFFVIFGGETIGSMIIIFLAKLKRTPVILLVDENIDVRKFYSLPIRLIGKLKMIGIKLVYRNAEVLLPETEAAKMYLKKQGCDIENVEVAPHGIDVNEITPQPPDIRFAKKIGIGEKEFKSKLKILYAGGFYKHKGIGTVLQLLEKGMLGSNKMIIIPIFGDVIDQYKPKLSKFKQVLLLPQLKRQEMRKLFSISDVVIVPSITHSSTERSPNIVSEAMASGKLVIGSDMGGIPTFIGDAGILVPEGDAKAIADILNEVSVKSENLKTYRNKARKHTENVLNIEVYSDIILRKYNEYIESRSGTGGGEPR